MKAPWWDNLLTEFFTENLVPFTLRDEREFKYQLTPTTSPPVHDVLGPRRGAPRPGPAPAAAPARGILGFFGF